MNLPTQLISLSCVLQAEEAEEEIVLAATELARSHAARFVRLQQVSRRAHMGGPWTLPPGMPFSHASSAG